MGDSRACGSTFITPHAWQCVRGAWYTHSGCVCVLVGTDDVCQLLIPLLCDYCSMGNVHECRCPFQQVPLHSNRIKVDVGHSCGNMLWAGLSKWWGAAERSVAGCGCSIVVLDDADRVDSLLCKRPLLACCITRSSAHAHWYGWKMSFCCPSSDTTSCTTPPCSCQQDKTPRDGCGGLQARAAELWGKLCECATLPASLNDLWGEWRWTVIQMIDVALHFSLG